MDGRNCKFRSSDRTGLDGTLVLRVGKPTLNYLKDADGVKLTLRHPHSDNAKSIVLTLGSLERTAREGDRMELCAKAGLPEREGRMTPPRKVVFRYGGSCVSFIVHEAKQAGPAAEPMAEGPILH